MKSYRRSQTIDAPADQVFAFVSEIGNLPKYLPPVTSAESAGGDQLRIRVEIPEHGGEDGQGYFRVQKAARRMEWGSNMGRDYAGNLTVTPQGADRCEVAVEIQFGPRSVGGQMEQRAGKQQAEETTEDALGRTLESIRRQIEGDGGKLPPNPPPR